MDATQEVIDQAKQLPPADQRRIIAALQRDLPDQSDEPETEEHRARRRAAMKNWLAKAGTAHSDYTDVSSNKYKHLAEIYADNHLPSDKK